MSKKNLVVLLLILTSFSNVFYSQTEETIFEKPLDLETCINYALKNHPTKQLNDNIVGISESQLKQAHSAYWPQIDATAAISTMDEDPNFIFPSSQMEIPEFGISGLMVPEQNVKLMDKTLVMGSVELVYPLYTGGYISSLIGQAEGGLLIAKEEARKNKLLLIADVKKRFTGVYIMQKLSAIGDETLARLETTLELTENLYLKGSGKVTKTDFLKNKILVDNIRSINASFKHNLILAKSALLNILGEKDVTKNISVVENELTENAVNFIYDDLLSQAFQNNPTWKTLQTAQVIYEEKVDEAFSGHLPKIGLKGSANIIENKYDFGMVTDVNKLSWTVALGVQLPIFNGFRTSAQVDEAKYQLEKIKTQKILLENGLGILVKKALVDFELATEQKTSLKSAMDTAVENQELNDRAYQSDLVELQDLMEAQLFEAVMEVQFYKSLYTYYETLADLEFVIGKTLE